MTRGGFSQNYSVSRILMDNLLRNYDKDVRPSEEFDNITYVNLAIYLKSIQEFDEVKQTVVLSAGFALRWNDTGMVWDTSDYGGIWKLQVSHDRVWTPDFILATSSKEMGTYGSAWQKISYTFYGDAFWMTAGLVQSTCEVNVKKYPFDTQQCVAQFILWGYEVFEVDFVISKPYVDLVLYKSSGSWDLIGTTISKSLLRIVDWPQIDVTFNMRRKSNFVLINVLGPLFLLDFLNLMAFFLVLESGERISYCLTVLLSITVFLTIISDTLPRTSESMPLISYKLMTDLVISTSITLASIFNLSLFHRSENRKIPTWLRQLYFTLYSLKKKTNKTDYKIKNIVAGGKHQDLKIKLDKPDINLEEKDVKRCPNLDRPISWKDICNMMDFLFFITFMTAFLLSSMCYFLSVAIH